MYPGDRRIPNDQSSITHAGFDLLNGFRFLYQSLISKKTVSEKQRWSFYLQTPELAEAFIVIQMINA